MLAVDELKFKLRVIKQLNPKAKIYVSPVLPNRIPRMNDNIIKYNCLVDTMLYECFPDVWFKGIYDFLDQNNLLSVRLTRTDDKIHLGPRGIARFVSYIKDCVYSREVRYRMLVKNKNLLPHPETANTSMVPTGAP